MIHDFPYTNFHDLNTDWIVERIGNVDHAVIESASSAEQAASSAEQAASSAEHAAASEESAQINADTLRNATEELELLKSRIENLVSADTGTKVTTVRSTNISPVDGTATTTFNLPEGYAILEALTKPHGTAVWHTGCGINELANVITLTLETTYDTDFMLIYSSTEAVPNAEVVDIRTGYNGTVYTSAGDAVRGQAAYNAKAIEFLGLTELNPTFHQGYYRYDTLAYSETGDHLVSDVILIPANTVLYVPKVNKSSSVSMITLALEDGTATQCLMRGTATSNSDGSYVEYPFTEDSYIILSGNRTMTDYMKYYLRKLDYDYVLNQDNFNILSHTSLDYLNGYITTSGATSNSAYKYTANIVLPKGMTIEYWASGSSPVICLSEFNMQFNFVRTLDAGDSYIKHQTYTADKHMCVRICAQIGPLTTGFTPVLPENKFYTWKIYYKNTHFENVKDDVLTGKHLTVMGDSLIAGNQIGTGVTWVSALGIKYNMNYVNLGVNAGSVAQVSENDNSMVNRINEIPLDTEYFVLLGGANDKRLNVPLGTPESTDRTTFYGALNIIMAAVRERCPKAKMLMLTTYCRYTSANTLGLTDADYANALKTAAYNKLIPCFDNYHDSGVDFTNEYMRSWMDESRNRQRLVSGQTTYYEDTHHFSIEGYEWITPIYEQVLKGL